MPIPHYTSLIANPEPTTKVMTITAPFDHAPIASVDCASENDIESALACAYALFKDKKNWLSLADRITILEKSKRLLSERQEIFALEAAREGGKPLIDSNVEVARAVDGIQICIETLRTDTGKVVPMRYNAGSAHRLAFTQKEPIGVVLAISAFNHPVNLIIHQVAAAIAAGCPVIIKPASDTPLSCLHLVALFHEAGLPKEWCQALVIKDNALAEKMVSDPRLGFLSFIGSAKVGWSLRSLLAPGVRCALEHGGVAPVIVCEDADLNTAVPLLIKGGFYHAGQVCVSVQRIFAHASIAEKLGALLATAAAKLKIGDPTLPETEVGPLIRSTEVVRIDDWVKEAVQGGAGLLTGGKVLSDSCYACTVLYNPLPTAKVSQLEVFGPVVCVYPYEELNTAILQANALPFAFQAAVFTQSLDAALRAYHYLDASAVMVNDHTAFRVDGMPFAGLRQSGLGVGGIPYTIHDMQIEKMMVIRSEEL